jgi:peptide/nickel transport system ATP-binding protein
MIKGADMSDSRTGSADDQLLLRVKNFTVSFRQYVSGLRQRDIQVIRNFTLDIMAGEILAVVGASGSGKSLLAHSILGILPENAHTSGSIRYKGVELTQKEKERLRGKEIALIPQSINYLDPSRKVANQIDSPISRTKSDIAAIVQKFQLSEDVVDKYPFQLSGGMARRVLIATAVASGAKLIIADEPTPGLHALVVEEILNALSDFAQAGCGVMMITHDIDLACGYSD